MNRTRLPLIFLLMIVGYTLMAQVPYAFRYQASVRDSENKPVHESVEFEIKLFQDDEALYEIYSERHVVKPDTNGLVAFSIGEGSTSDDFSAVVWADGPYYIQVMLDGEEISYSQLVSVPYAMHAQTASMLYDLQEPVSSKDPTTKAYVDSANTALIDSLTNALQAALAEAKYYSDSLAISPKDLEVSSTGDTLLIGTQKLYIPGMSSSNMEKYNEQLVLGGSYDETLTSVMKCSDSSYLMMGTTFSSNGDVQNFKGEADIWLVKISENLELEWAETFGGSAYDNGVVMLEEFDGYVIGATSESTDVFDNNGEFDIWLFKIDFDANILWESAYGGAGTEFLNSVLPTGDGGYYVGATTFSNGGDIDYLYGESDIWIFEIDANQNIVNSTTLGGSSFDALQAMALASESSSAALELYATSSSNSANITNNNGALDFVHLSLSEDFDLLEQDCYGSAHNEQLYDVLSQEDYTLMGGSVFADNWSVGTGNKFKNVYIEKVGDEPFSLTFGGSNSDVFIDFAEQNDTITILAQSASQDGDVPEAKGGTDVWIFQLSPDGQIINNDVYGGIYDESPKVLKALPDGSWLVAGESESNDNDLTDNAGDKDIWLLKLDKNLDKVWQKSYGGSYAEILTDIIVIDEQNFIICGTTSSNDYGIDGLHDKVGNGTDIWILKTEIE